VDKAGGFDGVKAISTRREGFTGQHLAVVPGPIRKAAARHPLLKSLMVTDAGYFPHAAGHRVERPQGAATHLFIACVKGLGWVRMGGQQQAIRGGDILWLRADEAHAYGSSDEEPWTICWAHFTGDEAAAWIDQLGWAAAIPFGLGRLPPDRMAELKLDQVYLALEHGYNMHQILSATAALRISFCAAIHLATLGRANRSATERVMAVRDQMREALSQPHRLNDLADAAGLSVPHFSVLFRQQTGYSPIDYLTRQRVQQACRLLDRTDAAISEIAALVGYDDPYYFTRCYGRVMGYSPRSYRSMVKG
jgi:AraC-like DNA-binding protein